MPTQTIDELAAELKAYIFDERAWATTSSAGLNGLVISRYKEAYLRMYEAAKALEIQLEASRTMCHHFLVRSTKQETAEIAELQRIVDASIAYLDPDNQK